MIYDIASFRIKIERMALLTKYEIEKFAVTGDSFDKELKISGEDLREEGNRVPGPVAKPRLFHLYALRRLAEWLPGRDAFLLHAACFDVDGVGIAFAALSGTGKTTHMLNWQEYLGDKMTIVNGDKPFIRFFDKDFCEEKGLNIPDGTEFGIPYAYGTPWNGKERFGCNMRTKLKHICFIERSERNFVTRIDKADAIERIMKQVYMPEDPEALHKTLELVNRLINSCELWVIHCNMNPESAEVAYKTIIGDSDVRWQTSDGR